MLHICEGHQVRYESLLHEGGAKLLEGGAFVGSGGGELGWGGWGGGTCPWLVKHRGCLLLDIYRGCLLLDEYRGSMLSAICNTHLCVIGIACTQLETQGQVFHD